MTLRNMAVLLAGLGLVGACTTTSQETPPPRAETRSVESRVDASRLDAAREAEARGDFPTAQAYYRAAYERNAKNVPAALGLARILRRLGRPREAVAIAERALEDNKNNADVRAELGKSQLAANDTLDAIESLSRAAALLPDDWEIQSALGVGYDRIGMYDQAGYSYERALAMAPSNAFVLNNYALSLAQVGKLEQAIQMLERATVMPERNAQMRQNLALLYAVGGRIEDAERLVKQDLAPDLAAENIAYYRRLAANSTRGVPRLPPNLPATAPGPGSMRAPDSTPALPIVPVAGASLPADRTETAADSETRKNAPAAVASAPATSTAAAAPAREGGAAPAAETPTAEKQEARSEPARAPTTATEVSAVGPADDASARRAAVDDNADTTGQDRPAPSASSAEPRPETTTRMDAAAPPAPAAPADREAPASVAAVEPRTAAAAGVDAPAANPATSERPRPLLPSLTRDDAGGRVTSGGTSGTAAAPRDSVREGGTGTSNDAAVAADMHEAERAATSPSSSAAAAGATNGTAVASLPAPAAPAPSAPAGKASASAAVGPVYRVQLGSYRKEADASHGMAMLRSAHGDLLADLGLGIVPVTLPESGDYFRILTAPLDSRASAAEICRELQDREVSCFVRRDP